MYNNFIAAPILGLMKAKNFKEALKIANNTKYGLCSVLQSLDEEQHLKWKNSMDVGNYYINCSIRSIIRRQPFGGRKKSTFGKGFKAGGPNYLMQCINCKQTSLPKEKKEVPEKVNMLSSFLEKIELSAEQLGLWYASISNYSYWWQRMKIFRDPTKIVGQDNFFGYMPNKKITLRITKKTHPLDALRICAIALTINLNLEVSFDKKIKSDIDWENLKHFLKVIEEPEEMFLERILEKDILKIRLTHKADKNLKKIAANSFCFIEESPVLANGRYELLNYLREEALSYDYHRGGNLGIREEELRKPIL